MNTTPKIYDVIVVGGGVVGCAIMRRLALQGISTLLLEKGGDILSGASKGNSAILHTGFDAPPNSLELSCIKKGYAEYLSLHEKFALPLLKTSAHIVAWNEEEKHALGDITIKAHGNGSSQVSIITKEELYQKEPNLAKGALGAVFVPGEYIIDPWSSPLAYLTQAVAHGADYQFHTEVLSGNFDKDLWGLQTNQGKFYAKIVINCGGNFADILEQICNEHHFTAKPRKGQFIVFDKSSSALVNSIILPVPSKTTKGVLICRTIFGNTILGPTAEEQEDRIEATVEKTILQQLIHKANHILPELICHDITTTYSGLRPATEHNEYQIRPYAEKNWICVAGIRSTGLTSALGIASYVDGLIDEYFSFIQKNPIADDKIIWPQMPNLAESSPRDYEQEESGEIFCHCEYVTQREIEAVFSSLVIPKNIEGVKRRTRAMMGRCNGFNCAHKIAELSQKYALDGFYDKGKTQK